MRPDLSDSGVHEDAVVPTLVLCATTAIGIAIVIFWLMWEAVEALMQ